MHAYGTHAASDGQYIASDGQYMASGASDARIQINLDAKETADESALPDLLGVFALLGDLSPGGIREEYPSRDMRGV